MAGRNDQNNKGGKKNTAAEQEQEEVVEVEAKEPERDQRQDQLGNQAIASMISSGAAGAGDGGGGGGGAGLAIRDLDEEKEGVDYGGDDDPAPADVSFDEATLAEAWRPRTKKSEDKQRFAESMPDDDLPPEDPEWIAAIRATPVPRLRAVEGAVEALVQPTDEVVASSLADWARGAFDWGPQGVVWRALRAALVPVAPGMLDPHGRVLLSRARSGAVGIAALSASPTLAHSTDPATCALVLFDLELRARRRHLIAHADAAAELFEGSLPIAADLFEARAPAHGARRPARDPGGAAVEVIERTLTELTDLVDPLGVLPVLRELAPPDEDEDPLNLQAVLDAHTGGAPPPAYQTAAVKAAERLAEQAAQGRVQLGAAATVIAEVADLWTHGPPREAMLTVLRQLDADVNEVMALLVDIARASQAGSVGPTGLNRGLRRGAKAIRGHRTRATRGLAVAAAASLPPGARVARPQTHDPDPLSEAWADGRPLDAVPWLDATCTGWERAAAIALTRLAAGELGTADTLSALVAGAPPMYGDSFATIRDAALLHDGRAPEVRPTPRAERALERRNGLQFAEASLTAIEAHLAAGGLDQAEAHRATAGVHAYHTHAHAGFSLLARWTSPDAESEIAD